MPVRILHGDIHLIDLKTRLPFKYGIATMTQAPQALVRMYLEVDGREVQGVSADLLPPRWFTKNPDKPLDEEISEMLQVIEHAVSCSAGVTGPTVFDVWREVFKIQDHWGCQHGLPSLLSQFGTTLVERAVIEAYCRIVERPFGVCVRANDFGIRLGEIHKPLRGRTPQELLPKAPHRRVIARHTVGIADPLEDSDIGEAARLDDGLPQSLAECVRRYGLTHFKLKVSGNTEQDADRLTRIATVIEGNVGNGFRLTLDGNESFRSLEAFRDFWETLLSTPPLARFLGHAMFVEQPFHRDMALDAGLLQGLLAWRGRPKLIIDESDAELDSLPRALALGYHGTSHKNCKGVFKGVANACLLESLRRQPDGNSLVTHELVMSGEDLANIGPVALLQDLAVVATLGVSSVERNGHHYFAGLSAFPESVQRLILEHHGDLYEPAVRGWPSLRIAHGELSLDSIVHAPLGVGFEVDVTQFTPAAHWKTPKIATENTK
jgi:hypothetical protein